jgi:pSer/pThr/pTyr-binding forkhead associated (FHA) protein
VQPRHARLIGEAGRWYIEDLHSESGTFLNGRRIDGRMQVAHGDAVRCGTSALELVCELGADTPEEAREGAASDLVQLRGRIDELERERALRDQQIRELREEIRGLEATLASVRAELAGTRERHEEVTADLRRRLADEHRDSVAATERHHACADSLLEAHAHIAELKQIIESLQGEASPWASYIRSE